MKVLTFCSYFEPEIASSMYLTMNLLEEMADQGIEVEVFAPTPTRGVSTDTIEKYKKIKHEEKYGGKVHVHRFSLMQEGTNTIGRAFRYALLTLAFIWKGLRTKADIMFIDSTPPTQGIMAAFLKKIKHIPMVYNLQDVFPDSLIHAGMTREDSLLWKIGRKMEDCTYRNADAIIAISEDMKENIIKKGVPNEKIAVVSNWIEESLFKPVSKKDNFIFDKFNISRETFNVVYAGNLGNAQNIDIIIDAAKNLENERNIRFYIFGNGAQEEIYKKKISALNLNNLEIYPMQPYEEATFVYSMGDVCIVPCKKGFGGSAMPSKTWSIMATGTPVLASFDSGTEMEKIIKENRVGLFSNADDLNALVENILTFFQNKNLVEEYGKNAEKYIEKNISRKKCTGKYIDIMRKAIK